MVCCSANALLSAVMAPRLATAVCSDSSRSLAFSARSALISASMRGMAFAMVCTSVPTSWIQAVASRTS